MRTPGCRGVQVARSVRSETTPRQKSTTRTHTHERMDGVVVHLFLSTMGMHGAMRLRLPWTMNRQRLA